MGFIDIIKTIIFGIVEGITEWLPVSSTGHLILLNDFMPLQTSPEFFNMFLVVIQLGAILAVIVTFFRKMWPFSSYLTDRERKKIWQNWLKVIIGCIPAAVAGFLLNDFFDEHLSGTTVVAVALIVYGVIFILIERFNKDRNFYVNEVSELSYFGAFLIGCFQMLALVPGTSRSGVTIIGAMLLGVCRSAAAEFSFYLSVPIMLGASVLKIHDFGLHFTGNELAVLLIGMAASFLVSIAAIRFLMNFIRTRDFKPFGIYRIIIGIVILLYFAAAH
ncbi:MAG: undecaprenyl-diphosphate phosphatase [Lachnospiraceae bacterium]|nr:undecaprenyl-diphosphate phosphatase [Lachnospiraceae bacterium]